jgi:hypothetical protein
MAIWALMKGIVALRPSSRSSRSTIPPSTSFGKGEVFYVKASLSTSRDERVFNVTCEVDKIVTRKGGLNCDPLKI